MHACRSTLEDPTARVEDWEVRVDPALEDGGIALVDLELAAGMEA